MNYANLIDCKSAEEVSKAILQWSSDKTEKEHLIRAAILETHALVETNLKSLLFEFLIPSVVYHETKKEFEECKQILYEKISRMSFHQVYTLLKTGLDSFDNVNLKSISEINSVRNSAVHGNIEKIKYKNRNPFMDYDCLAQIFLDGWSVRQALDKYYEIYIDNRKYNDKKYMEFYYKYKDKI